MNLTINGQTQALPDGRSLGATITALCPDPALVIAELNGAVIDRAAWPATPLGEGDRLELITFVGGG